MVIYLELFAALKQIGTFATDGPMTTDLAAVDGLCLDLTIPSPYRFIFPPNCLAPYKLVFRRLLEVRLTVRALGSTTDVLHSLVQRHRNDGNSEYRMNDLQYA